MEIDTRHYKRVDVLRIVGRIDANTAPEFDARLKEAVGSGHSHLILEMDATEFLSSAGARALLSAHKTLKSKGGGVAISQPSQMVLDVLRLAGFDVLFTVYPTTESAIGAV